MPDELAKLEAARPAGGLVKTSVFGRWQGRAAAIILVAVVTTGLVAWLYAYVLTPYLYRQSVNEAMAALADDASFASSLQDAAALPEAEKAAKVGSLLAYNPGVLTAEERGRLARDAFALAIYLGDASARIAYGEALKIGKLGPPDAEAADAQFTLAVKELRGPAAMGDGRAAYAFAKLLASGRGIEPDPEGAVRLAKLAYKQLPANELREVFYAASEGSGVFTRPDKEVALSAALLLFEKGKPVPMRAVTDLCENAFGPAVARAVARAKESLQAGSEVGYVRQLADDLDTANENLDGCKVEALQPFAKAGSTEAASMLAAQAPSR